MTFLSEQTKEYTLIGKKVTVKWKVPTVEEFDEFVLGNKRLTELFKSFVKEIKSEIPELDGAFPSEVLKLPGLFSFVSKVGKDIEKSAMLTDDEKN